MKVLGAFLATTLAAVPVSAIASDLYSPHSPAYTPAPVVGVDAILSANNQLSIQFVTTNFDYSEHLANGTLFDTEKGWVPGIGAEISVMQNFLMPNFYFDAAFSYVTSKTDYVGGYTGANPTPYGSVIAKDGADVYDTDFRVGKGFWLAPSFMATPYVGIGFHEWDRAVNQGEVYSHGYVGGGLMLQWSPTDRLVLEAHGVVGSTFASHITVNGPIGFSGNLGDSLLWKAGGGVDYAIAPQWHATAKAELTEFDYGHSANYTVGNWIVSEPNSSTQNITVKAGIGYSWGGDYIPLK